MVLARRSVSLISSWTQHLCRYDSHLCLGPLHCAARRLSLRLGEEDESANRSNTFSFSLFQSQRFTSAAKAADAECGGAHLSSHETHCNASEPPRVNELSRTTSPTDTTKSTALRTQPPSLPESHSGAAPLPAAASDISDLFAVMTGSTEATGVVHTGGSSDHNADESVVDAICVSSPGGATNLIDHRASLTQLPRAPPRLHPPLEIAPPRAAPEQRKKGVTHSDATATSHAVFSRELSTGEPQADAASPLPPPKLTATHAAYSEVFQSSFVNPFNGRLMSVASKVAQLLFSVGFYRSQTNTLHLEWNPAAYMVALQTKMALVKKRAARRQLRVQKQRLKEGKTDQTEGETASELSPERAMEAARATLLRPFWHHGAKHWTAAVGHLLERQDVFIFLNKELERLYADLHQAYMPPKLDTPLDPTLSDMVLTSDQRHVVDLVLHGFSVFVGGSAGTGKTVLLKSIYRKLTQLGLRVAVTATTGVAAVQLGGCTFHHAFNAPVEAVPHRWDTNALRAVDVVIIDEVSLLDACMLDAFDMEARLARLSSAPFGGLQLIICGDFLQLSREETLPAYESTAFQHLIALRLVTPMRHRAEEPLLKLLEGLRRGQFDAPQFKGLDRPIPSDVTHITFIFPRRREAQQLNDQKLSELCSPEMIFAPQRGQLQLRGTFTPAALVELDRDAHGMRPTLPPRERLLDMVNEEAARLWSGSAAGANGNERPCIADHELVVMPIKADGPTSMRFILRVRYRERATLVLDGVADGEGRVCSLTDLSATTSPSRQPLPASTLGKSAFANESVTAASTRQSMLSLPTKNTRRMTAPFSPGEWEKIATAVTARIGGHVITMLEEVPMSLVPLSVTMSLADMTRADVATSLSPLRLKLGCRVMINRNLSRTVSNGSVGVVEAFAPPDLSLFPRRSDRIMRALYHRICESALFPQLPVVRLLSGEVVQIPPVSVSLGGTAQSYYYGHDVLLMPLQLGYAFTVHKVQGLTLQGTVVLDCEKFFDCPHLIYVACSRVRSLDQLIVHHVEPRMIIVRQSALEFSDRLCDARKSQLMDPPLATVRADWSLRSSSRILSLSD